MPVEGVVVGEVAKRRDPAIDPEQVERRGRDEVDGSPRRPEEAPDLRNAPQGLSGRSRTHARPHQSRTRSASTCAVCTTDGTWTRSSTPWMRSAYGPMQAAGIPEPMKARASVVAVVGPVLAGDPATA